MDDSATRSVDLLSHVLVPVATEKDARETANRLAVYDPETVTVLHVVEKGDGSPDKTPVEQSESVAAASFEAVREVFPDAETATAYDRKVLRAIFETADKVDASAIAYRSRGGNRLVHMISGDLSLKLVTKSDRPVIALPRTEPEA